MAKTVAELKAEKAAIERRIKQAASKEAKERRTAENRRKYVIAGAVLAALKAGGLRFGVPTPEGQEAQWMLASGYEGSGDADLVVLLDQYVRQPHDRAAVGLPPLP